MPASRSPISSLPAFDEAGDLNVVIETPRGSRNKLAFDAKLGVFTLKKVLAEGLVFPWDFGFVPSTKAGDGDPLDVLVLMDESSAPAVLVRARPIGILKADQSEDGETEENDRVIAVACASQRWSDVRELEDLPGTIVEQIEHFFVTYNAEEGKRFNVRSRAGARAAEDAVKRAMVKRTRRKR
jgi:inorganic pyrophosphatase